MYKFIFPLCIVLLAGCSQGDNAPDARVIQLPTSKQIVATINATPVPRSLLDAVAHDHYIDLSKPTERDKALKLTTDMVLMSQLAKRENFAAQPEFRAQVEAARLAGVAAAVMAQLQKQTPIDDSTLKAQYDAEVARAGKNVYDFTQLLFANEDDAIKAESEVLAGKSFQDVFNQWAGKAKQAKAFTRVRLDQVPKPLAEALQSMQNGDTTKVPIKTEFGWHVVHLDISNPFSPPPFEQVKQGIRHSLQMKIAQERLSKLREQAKIEYPPGMAPTAKEPATAPVEAAAQSPAPKQG